MSRRENPRLGQRPGPAYGARSATRDFIATTEPNYPIDATVPAGVAPFVTLPPVTDDVIVQANLFVVRCTA